MGHGFVTQTRDIPVLAYVLVFFFLSLGSGNFLYFSSLRDFFG